MIYMYIFEKIQKKGFYGCMKAIKHRVIYYYNRIFVMLYEKRSIDVNCIVLESEGDCCDNAYALFDYMKQNGYIGKYRIVWLVKHPENFQDEEYIAYVDKNIDEHFAAKTIKVLKTCKWYIYDHCNLLSAIGKKPEQRISYLCHGYAGFKAPKGRGRFDGDEEFTTGSIPVQGCIDWDGKETPKYILGFSRLDYFYDYKQEYKAKAIQMISGDKYKKIFLWMPTFRQSINKELSEDYIKNETGLPLFNTFESLKSMNEYLRLHNIKIVLKIHHLQAGLDIFKKEFSNFQFLKDEDLAKCGLQLYQFIPVFDALITDYSSISTDYFLLDKPIIYVLDDIAEYNKSRGLYPDNATDYMPGDHVYNINELKIAMDRVVNGEDAFKKQRNELLPQFHTYQDGNASKRILAHLEITNGE